MKRSSKR